MKQILSWLGMVVVVIALAGGGVGYIIGVNSASCEKSESSQK